MKIFFASTLLAMSFTVAAQAQQAAGGHDAHGAGAAPAAAALSEGVVRKIDRDAKKITLRHGPLANLGMPPMTMVFQVDDTALLDKVGVGDKVRFSAENSGGALVLRRIEKSE